MALRTGFAWNKDQTFVPDWFHDSIAFFFKARETKAKRSFVVFVDSVSVLLPRFSQLENFHNVFWHEILSKRFDNDSCLLELIGNERVPSNIYIYSSRI